MDQNVSKRWPIEYSHSKYIASISDSESCQRYKFIPSPFVSNRPLGVNGSYHGTVIDYFFFLKCQIPYGRSLDRSRHSKVRQCSKYSRIWITPRRLRYSFSETFSYSTLTWLQGREGCSKMYYHSHIVQIMTEQGLIRH